MSNLERYKAGELVALMTWHGTFVTHVYIGDTLCHQSLDLASGELANLLIDSVLLEASTPNGFWLTKVNSLPMAFPKLRLFSSSGGFLSFQCVDGYNLYPDGKGHLITAEENTGRICIDRDVEKEWERFVPVSFRLMLGLSALLNSGRLAGQIEDRGENFRLHAGAVLTYGAHVFSIIINHHLILRVGDKTLKVDMNLSAKQELFLLRDNTGSDYEVIF